LIKHAVESLNDSVALLTIFWTRSQGGGLPGNIAVTVARSIVYLVAVAFDDDALASFILPLTRTTSLSHLIGESFQSCAYRLFLGSLARV
jgi:hypothetical protein